MSAATISVCMFDNEVVRGGAEEHLLCLLRRLDRGRFRPMLVCSPELHAALQPNLPSDVQVLPLALRSHRQMSLMGQLRDFLRHEQVQILHSHGFRPSLLASPVGCWAGVPVMIETPHVREYWRAGWKASFVIDRVASQFIDRYIAVSLANREYLLKDKELPAEKVALIRNGCDVDLPLSTACTAPGELKRGAGFDENDPLLLVAARLEPQKGHSVLLHAMVMIKRQFPNVRLAMLGGGSLRPELERKVRELGLADSVFMPGHCSNVHDWILASNVCVLPSFAEGLPLFAIESLGARRAMVATSVDGTPEIVVDGRTGLTVPPGKPVLLAGAITRLLSDCRLSAQLGEAGGEWVRTWFTLDRQIRETEELYEQLWREKTGKTDASQIEEVGPKVVS